MFRPWFLSILALPALATNLVQPPRTIAALEKRATACPTDYFSCASQGSAFSSLCCKNGWSCTLDADRNPACCPGGYVCTGTVPTPTGVSYVANSYFPFPYIATSFANADACSSAVSQCSSNYQVCTAGLEGNGGYGVTIAVTGGGGTTVAQVAATLPTVSAESICSSLSSKACYNLQASQCVQTTGNSFVVGAAPKPTGMGMAGVVAGCGLALLGVNY